MRAFYNGKRVLITGHTGFKGSWMCKLLLSLGARVYGYGLEAPTEPALFVLCNLADKIDSTIGDIRDLENLQKTFDRVQPEIVFHLAAQPIVRESYKDPVGTYGTNVMGTVNLLECVRQTTSVKSAVNVTTDKVYKNKEWFWGYREEEELNGYDPYSNSKSCSELVTSSYKNSFFGDSACAISTARAGNVIGGGDFAVDRIIPDCVRAAGKKEPIIVRNPYSTRPYQHVLEPLYAYLLIAMRQYEDKAKYEGNYNIGPDDCDCVATGELVDLFCKEWTSQWSQKMTWENKHDGGPHEANFLKLDCAKAKEVFEWQPRWHMEDVMRLLVRWYGAYLQQEDIEQVMDDQIEEFFV